MVLDVLWLCTIICIVISSFDITPVFYMGVASNLVYSLHDVRCKMAIFIIIIFDNSSWIWPKKKEFGLAFVSVSIAFFSLTASIAAYRSWFGMVKRLSYGDACQI